MPVYLFQGFLSDVCCTALCRWDWDAVVTYITAWDQFECFTVITSTHRQNERLDSKSYSCARLVTGKMGQVLGSPLVSLGLCWEGAGCIIQRSWGVQEYFCTNTGRD